MTTKSRGRRLLVLAIVGAAVACLTVLGVIWARDPVEAPVGGDLPGRIVLRADFESGDLSQFRGAQAAREDQIVVVESPVAQGRRSGRFEVRQGDRWKDASGDRAEVVADTGETEGAVRWYRWRTMFDDDYPTTSHGWQIFMQWHAEIGASQAMLQFFTAEDEIGFKTVESGSDLEPRPSRTHWTAPMDRGRWHDFRLHVRWSSDPARGFVELWHDGRRVVERTSLATLIPGYDAYIKQGLYRSGEITERAVVFHDGLIATAVG